MTHMHKCSPECSGLKLSPSLKALAADATHYVILTVGMANLFQTIHQALKGNGHA